MSTDAFETSRLLAILAVVILRFTLMPVYLQSYLNMAPDRLYEMKKEIGQISSVELQKKVYGILFY